MSKKRIEKINDDEKEEVFESTTKKEEFLDEVVVQDYKYGFSYFVSENEKTKSNISIRKSFGVWYKNIKNKSLLEKHSMNEWNEFLNEFLNRKIEN
jgi:hypothetical protein